MMLRVFACVLAAVTLMACGIILLGNRRRFLLTDYTPATTRRQRFRQLFLASFLTLFAELAFIRWISVEVPLFAYFKNLALLLCFIGFGLGCALAHKPPRWISGISAFVALVFIVRFPIHDGRWLDGLSRSLGAGHDLEIWSVKNPAHWSLFLSGALTAAALFALMAWIFVPLGQIVSKQIEGAKSPLSAYSWNLLSSLLGVLVFLGVSRLMLPASVWLGAAFLGFTSLPPTRRSRLLMSTLLLPVILMLHDPRGRDSYTVWTPYQQIDYTRHYAPNGDFWGGELRVNHVGYQYIVNLSQSFLIRHPGLVAEGLDENPYNLPFRFTTLSPSTLIVGSGTGNDVASALRHNSRYVDAVEIDPAILALGKREHPEGPYDSSQIHVHLTDARAFLRRTSERYDLVLFGLLDSVTQFSDYANMRIDNFVYTKESFVQASRHLNVDGVLFVKFHVDRPWIATRLDKMLRETFGKAPLVFYAGSSYGATATCFVISPASRVEDALRADPRLAEFVRQNVVVPENKDVPITTDDWPYLYQEGRWIPHVYYSLGVLVSLVTFLLYWQIPEARRQSPSLFFFAMGAGFLLIESQIISRLALFFGTTWQVNGIVFCALLVILLFANVFVEHSRAGVPQVWVFAALFVSLGLAYWLPLNELAGPVATMILVLPALFAGVLFAVEFRATESPSAALGANILGAATGGLLESLSLIVGIRSLLLVTIGLYCLAAIGLWLRRQEPSERAALYSH